MVQTLSGIKKKNIFETPLTPSQEWIGRGGDGGCVKKMFILS